MVRHSCRLHRLHPLFPAHSPEGRSGLGARDLGGRGSPRPGLGDLGVILSPILVTDWGGRLVDRVALENLTLTHSGTAHASPSSSMASLLPLRASPIDRRSLTYGARAAISGPCRGGFQNRASGQIGERGGKENLALARYLGRFPLEEASSMKKSRCLAKKVRSPGKSRDGVSYSAAGAVRGQKVRFRS